MAFDLFQDENEARGVPPNSTFQAGISDFDPAGTSIEVGKLLPWASQEEATWVYYEVAISCHLDAGIVVHNTLPQADDAYDTLGSYDTFQANAEQVTGLGVNTTSKGAWKDFAQRMAHSRYFFRLYGRALRLGQQVPIPTLKTVAGQTAIPLGQPMDTAFNRIRGNYSGVPLWHAEWSLWYTVTAPPKSAQVPPPNLAEHIQGDVALPDQWQSPFSQPDDEAVTTNPLPQPRP